MRARSLCHMALLSRAVGLGGIWQVLLGVSLMGEEDAALVISGNYTA